MLTGILSAESRLQASDRAANKFVKAGRFFLAISVLIFGVDHFMFATFIAALVPSWIPFHLFWAYFTGASFVAAAFAIAFNKWWALGRYATWAHVLPLGGPSSRTQSGGQSAEWG